MNLCSFVSLFFNIALGSTFNSNIVLMLANTSSLLNRKALPILIRSDSERSVEKPELIILSISVCCFTIHAGLAQST